MRKYSQNVPPATTTAREQEEKVSTITREYTLLTPLFGGGVEPTEYDPVTIVRATEIRAHLRFWWRACRGGGYKTIEELKKAENAIWGKAHKKGDKDTLKHRQTVQVVVEISNEDEKEPTWPVLERPFKIVKNEKKGRYESLPNWDTDIHPYAAFPLKPPQEELNKVPLTSPPPETLPVYTGIRFTVALIFPKKYKSDIEATLWAWETFGGLGARTRRGFGALYPIKRDSKDETSEEGVVDGDEKESIDLPPSSSEIDVKAWIHSHLEKCVVNGEPPKGTVYLSKNLRFCVATKSDDARIAWYELIEKLRAFRQDDHGRPKKDRFKYGRSYWPEAEAIREITGLGNRDKHKSLGHPQKFPRAVFGLPIEFHFPGEIPDKQSPTLQSAVEDSDRLGSPIILRPLACLNNETIGLAVLLDGFMLPPEGIILKEKNERVRKKSKKEEKKRETQLTTDDLDKLPHLKLSQTDVLQAFMDYLEGK